MAMIQKGIEQKGIEGEQYVSKELRSRGYFVINKGQQRKSEDLEVENPETNEEFYVQVKYKEPRKHYPDTGFEMWRYENYLKLNQQRKLLILFTDNSGKIYGDWIDNLGIEEGHGNTWNSEENCEMIYWWIKNLKDLRELLPNLNEEN